MSDADAFLDAIHADPQNDLPRLVYADWLEEQGHAAYAEFIRVSCRLAQETLPPATRRDLRRQRFALFEQFRAGHPQAVAQVPLSVNDFPRGIFTEHFQLTADGFVRTSPHWWPFICPRTVTLRDPSGYEEAIARSPYLGRVERLRCLGLFNVDNPFDHPVREPAGGILLRELSCSAYTTRLRVLEVDAVRASPADLCSLALSPLALRLEGLWLVIRLADGSDHILRVEQASGEYEIRDELNSFAHGYSDRLIPNDHSGGLGRYD